MAEKRTPYHDAPIAVSDESTVVSEFVADEVREAAYQGEYGRCLVLNRVCGNMEAFVAVMLWSYAVWKSSRPTASCKIL